ncbi:MAG TPA: DNA gyrase C-terminal beta-propeller domain-containing protein, partial [Candidatus Babeliales bacterium]|nr:DNA gyrase C-terminal beta-propeller domain-containing protein [Candidatus Babeliales bacterium]
LHREEVVYRRTKYDLKRAQQREHLLLGFIIALEQIDAIVTLIKQSRTAEAAITSLGEQYQLTPEQAKAILEMRLQRLTGLEQAKIHEELREITTLITHLRAILGDREILKAEILRELEELKATYGDERRTKITGAIDILTEADLIPDEDVVVTLTRRGYVKRVPLNTYGVQHRGGKGKMGMADLDDRDDVVQDIFVAKTHDELLFFTNLGRVYSLKVFEVPEGSRTARGRAVVNLLQLTENEQVVKLLCARDLAGQNVVMTTKLGIIKKTAADAFEKIRTSGIRALTLNEGDELVFAGLSSGQDSIVMATANGQGIRFTEQEVRPMGRPAAGVIGIRMRTGDRVIGTEIIKDDRDLLFATENGYGKRVRIADFRIAHRGGLGVRTIPANKRNGHVIGLTVVGADASVLLIDKAGKIIRLSPQEIRTMGRQASGVRLIRLDVEQTLAAVVGFIESAGPELTSSGSSGL